MQNFVGNNQIYDEELLRKHEKVLQKANELVRERMLDYVQGDQVDAALMFMAIETNFQDMKNQGFYITKFHLILYPEFNVIIDGEYVKEPDNWSFEGLITALMNLYIPYDKTNNRITEIKIQKGEPIWVAIREYQKGTPFDLQKVPSQQGVQI